MDAYKTGSTFAGYTIKGLVAGGGMGQVYAASHDVYATPVALKVLHPKLHADKSWMKRFSVEGLVGTRLKHPNILSARELVTDGGRIALVMDLVSGGQTLEKMITREHRSGLPLVQALKIFLQIVQGVEYLHGKSIVHGDMKPENVLIEGDFRDPDSWTPKVTDFGTVTLIADPVMIDGKPAVVATPRYASPEHLYGIDKVSEISDIYALGLVLHFLVTGKHPSTAKTVEQAARFVRNELSLVALVDQPDSLINLYQTACALEPEDRYPDARELALAVRAILDEVGEKLDLVDLQADLATEIDEERAAEAKAQKQADKEAAAEGEGGEPVSETQMETELDLGLPIQEDSTTAKGAAAVPNPDEMPEVPEVEPPEMQPIEDTPAPVAPVEVAYETEDPAPAPDPEEPEGLADEEFADLEGEEHRPEPTVARAEPPAEEPPGEFEPEGSTAEPEAAEQKLAPVPADTVSSDGPVPWWLWLIIIGTLGFIVLVTVMAWNG